MEGPDPGVPLSVASEAGTLEFTATPELADVLRMAAVIHRETGKPESYGFRAILLALVYSRHKISTWFKSVTLDTGCIERGTFLKYGKIEPEHAETFLSGAAASPSAADPEPHRTATRHSLAWLTSAHNWAHQQGHERTGLRHLMGAFLFEPEIYATEPQQWGFDRRALAFKYVAWTEEGLSDSDHAFWDGAFARVFAREAPPPSPENLFVAWRVEPGHLEPSILESEGELWSLGPIERADPGTRVLLVRVGQAPEGLIGIGSVQAQPSPVITRLPDDDATIGLMARIVWTRREESPLITMRRLLSAFGEVVWNRLQSGAPIPSAVADLIVASLYSPGPAFPDSLPQIENDGVNGTPHIDIRADVSAIARVMCMRDVKPPLSIALFGNWGSGKSFFMRQLQNKVNDIRTSSWAEGSASAFYSGVVQIEFNAWHYVEANLWASLVFHLFEHLRTSDEVGKAEKERAALLNELGAVTEGRVNAERDLETARGAEERARRDLVDKQTEAQRKEIALQRVSSVDVLARAVLTPDFNASLKEAADILGLSEVVSSTKEAQSVIEDAKQFEHETSAALRAFVHAPGLSKRLGLLLLALVAPPCAFALLSLVPRLAESDGWNSLLAAVGSLVALLAGAVPPIRSTLRYAKKAAGALKKAHQSLAAAVKKGEDAVADETSVARQALATASSDVKAAQEALTRADDKVKLATDKLLAASPIRILNSFIEERSASDDYRKSLGTMALVRRDFDKLSSLLTRARDFRKLSKQGNLTPEEQKLAKLPAIDRIILYIDDLDRCPPKQVIEVLQAIHLLLAFELFVVVVGVDPRWVSRSLKKHYPELLAEESSTGAANGDTSADIARPLDYLEKIFQIPFWLKPIDTTETGTLVKGLLGGDKAAPKTERPVQPMTAPPPVPAPGAAASQPTGGGNPSTPAPPSANPAPPASGTGVPPDDDPPPGPTVVSADEIKYMAELGQAAGTTPRAIKRYVNVYRLLRTRVSEDRDDEYQGEPGEPREFEVVMQLLAVLNTTPRYAEILGQALARRAETDLLEALVRELLFDPKTDAERLAQGLISTYARGQWKRPPTVKAYKYWYPVVARYSFAGG